jgi:hypothetical protein
MDRNSRAGGSRKRLDRKRLD